MEIKKWNIYLRISLIEEFFNIEIGFFELSNVCPILSSEFLKTLVW